MKIAFLVTSINSKSGGLGGHYYSLVETVNQIAKHHEVLIVNIGNNEAKSLQGTNYKTYKIINSGFSFFKTYTTLKKILIGEKPDVLHAFDSLAHYWTRFLGRQLKIPYCLTKCGGVNPIKYFPYTNDLILFSKENLFFFESHPKFKDSSLHLIPNRVKPFDDDHERINEIEKSLGEYRSSFKFLRISRICDYYRKSTLQLVDLVGKLRSDGLDCCVIFVGVVEDEKFFLELRGLNREYIFFFTTEKFTRNARELIVFSNAVMGTGRSFMEATAKEKIMLTPLANTKYPLLITSVNFHQAFNCNFSERLRLDGHNETENYSLLKETLQNKDLQCDLQKYSKRVFQKYFDSGNVAKQYIEVYSSLKLNRRPHYADFLLHTLFLFRSYLR